MAFRPSEAHAISFVIRRDFPPTADHGRLAWCARSSVQKLLRSHAGCDIMSLVRLLGFTTLSCGCVVGRYRELATSREVAYVEEKGKACGSHGHRRNHTVAADRLTPFATASLGKAS